MAGGDIVTLLYTYIVNKCAQSAMYCLSSDTCTINILKGVYFVCEWCLANVFVVLKHRVRAKRA